MMENEQLLCPVAKDECVKDACAWWSKYCDQCAILALADGLNGWGEQWTDIERHREKVNRAREMP